MVFSLNSDDYLGTCNGKTRFPLTSNITSTVYRMIKK